MAGSRSHYEFQLKVLLFSFLFIGAFGEHSVHVYKFTRERERHKIALVGKFAVYRHTVCTSTSEV